ncbi:MAG: NAD(P)-binding protein, partial [Phormidesmis sp.]
MNSKDDNYDVAIIGSGIAGSTLGTILARQGLKVIIFEAHSHPKFSIGESMILETSEIMRSIATLYDVPELAFYSSEAYFPWIGTSHGVKRHFSYLYHQEGQTDYDLSKVLQAVIPKDPYGHELHIYRQDSDYFLTAIAVRYGATVLQNTRIQDIDIDDQGTYIRWSSTQGIRASYVV